MGYQNSNAREMSRGIGLMGDLVDFVGQPERRLRGKTPEEHEEVARMMELDARKAAMEAENTNTDTADRLRSEQERNRARKRAGWGRSNIAMSGSRALVRDSRELADKEAEEDIRSDGETEVTGILNQGKRKANLYRISGGASPSRTILTLGSSIYDKEL